MVRGNVGSRRQPWRVGVPTGATTSCTSTRLFREDRGGLEELHRETLVMTDWDGDEQVVLIENEAEL